MPYTPAQIETLHERHSGELWNFPTFYTDWNIIEAGDALVAAARAKNANGVPLGIFSVSGGEFTGFLPGRDTDDPRYWKGMEGRRRNNLFDFAGDLLKLGQYGLIREDATGGLDWLGMCAKLKDAGFLKMYESDFLLHDRDTFLGRQDFFRSAIILAGETHTWLIPKSDFRRFVDRPERERSAQGWDLLFGEKMKAFVHIGEDGEFAMIDVSGRDLDSRIRQAAKIMETLPDWYPGDGPEERLLCSTVSRFRVRDGRNFRIFHAKPEMEPAAKAQSRPMPRIGKQERKGMRNGQ